MSHLTEQSRSFIESGPEGGWYCLSREGAGIDFSGQAGEDARRLSRLNFERLAAQGIHVGPVRSSLDRPH